MNVYSLAAVIAPADGGSTGAGLRGGT